MSFAPGFNLNLKRNEKDLWFVFRENKILIKMLDGNIIIPNYEDLCEAHLGEIEGEFVGAVDGLNCYAAGVPAETADGNGLEFKDLRFVVNTIDHETALICSRASQILNWDRNHKYCGKCGTLNNRKTDERAKVCPNCGSLTYPSVSPAIIVAIVKDNKLLLAHNKNFAPKMYSVIAGFVEYGEVFEDCVRREVFEEVGIRVKNIKYFASQPWPFPNSMMVAFTAEHESGEIKVDKVEIEDAGWFGVDELPNLPGRGSIARRLIEWFVETYK